MLLYVSPTCKKYYLASGVVMHHERCRGGEVACPAHHRLYETFDLELSRSRSRHNKESAITGHDASRDARDLAKFHVLVASTKSPKSLTRWAQKIARPATCAVSTFAGE